MTPITITAGAWTGFLGKGLAPRELEATLYAAADLTAKQTARLMGVTPGTVSKRLDDARFKLGARSVRGLVVEAFQRGLIHLSCGGLNASPDPHQGHDECDGVFIA